MPFRNPPRTYERVSRQRNVTFLSLFTGQYNPSVEIITFIEKTKRTYVHGSNDMHNEIIEGRMKWKRLASNSLRLLVRQKVETEEPSRVSGSLFGVAHWRASHRLPPGLNRQESHSHRKGIHSKVMKMEDEVQE